MSVKGYDVACPSKMGDPSTGLWFLQAVAYVPLKLQSGKVVFGVGSDTNIDQAAVRAIVAGINRIEGENGA